MNEQTVALNGKTVRYWQTGANQPRTVLLLHGLADAQSNWSAVVPVLAEQFQVIAPDLPGFGGSAALAARPTPELLLNWIKQFVELLNIEQVAVVGHSFGAVLARLFSAIYPQYVPALVLVSGGTIPNVPRQLRWMGRLPVVGSSMFYTLARSTTSGLTRMVHDPKALPPDFAVQTQANISGLAAMMRMMATANMPEKRTPPVPTLLLWGEVDSINTLDEAERIKAAIPGAQLARIAECGGLPQIEAPEVLAWQVQQFLDNLNRPSKPSLPGVGLLRG